MAGHRRLLPSLPQAAVFDIVMPLIAANADVAFVCRDDATMPLRDDGRPLIR